jgi:cyclic pyranopterin phosphate synthase
VLLDGFGRTARDLRLSLTDRCNLRCTYCMPAEGLAWLPTADQLTVEEFRDLARICVANGIERIRLTGGEPLIHPELERLIALLASLDPRPELALTTNGIGLAARAEGLRTAGLDRINISLDTLDAERFAAITRRDRHADVMAGIAAAQRVGFDRVKVNAVLMRGINDDEAAHLLRWSLDEGVELRFIEQMPLDAQHAWDRATMVSAGETRELLERDFALEPLPGRGSAPAERFRVSERSGPRVGVVGIIASVSEPFCAACDRLRITSDGQIRNCLFAHSETDLRGILRAPHADAQARDRAVAHAMGLSWREKKRGHGIGDPDFVQPERSMSAIGG